MNESPRSRKDVILRYLAPAGLTVTGAMGLFLYTNSRPQPADNLPATVEVPNGAMEPTHTVDYKQSAAAFLLFFTVAGSVATMASCIRTDSRSQIEQQPLN